MTLKEYYRKNDRAISSAITTALKEDKVRHDITTELILKGTEGSQVRSAVLWCKEDCVLAGVDIFKKVYKEVNSRVRFKTFHTDGAKLKKGSKVLVVTAPVRTLLTGERTALNFLQRMSGIASLTGKLVKQLKFKDAKILHTRKTTPNFRAFEAAAVKIGGGEFHRLSLGSSVMIKDNHIEALGGIKNVFRFLSKKNLTQRQKQKFEIEVKGFKEIQTVLNMGKGLVKVVMLDNFRPADIEKAVRSLKKAGFSIEVSGGINIGNFAKYQKKGVDYYSIGALTHAYKSCDFSLDF